MQAELSALVMRYVAEDVAVYNSDILGGRMKELLYGLTSTLPQALPAMYRLLEVSEDFVLFSTLFSPSHPPALCDSVRDSTPLTNKHKDQPTEHPRVEFL